MFLIFFFSSLLLFRPFQYHKGLFGPLCPGWSRASSCESLFWVSFLFTCLYLFSCGISIAGAYVMGGCWGGGMR